jgi:CMP/dCMP kinase
MQKIIITIDGFSSTGKSTIAKELAQHLGYVYVDTGAMYRAVTLYAMQNGYISQHEFNISDLISQLNSIELSFKFNSSLGFSEMYLNGINVEKEIRTLEVSQFVSQVSAVSEVRRKLVEQQQLMGVNKGIVMDGRDIGTVVFPNADLKFFITASAETRAKRRFKELQERGDKIDYSDVLHNIESRDHIDSTRKDSPLIKAVDAIEIDNSELSLEKQFTKIMQFVKNALENQK